MEAADFQMIRVKEEKIETETECVSKDSVEINSGCSSVSSYFPVLKMKHEADQERMPQMLLKQELQSVSDYNIDNTTDNLEQNSLPSCTSLQKHVAKLENDNDKIVIEIEPMIKDEPDSDYDDDNDINTVRKCKVSIVPASSSVDNHPCKVENEEYDINQPSCSSVAKNWNEFDKEINDDLPHKQNKEGDKTYSDFNEWECRKPQETASAVGRETKLVIEIGIIKEELQRHLELHKGGKQYQCSICNKGFTQKAHLQRHMKVHTGECLSDRQFSSTDGERRFQCTVCDKAFKQSSHLKTHSKVHSGEKSYQCTICCETFQERSHLSDHLVTHGGEKPYRCSVCDKAFAKNYNLKIHMRLHTGEKPFQCTICNKFCRLRSNLKVHMKTHSGERPYQCPLCDKSFVMKTSLLNHSKVHNEQTSHKCLICDETFQELDQLKVHLVDHKMHCCFVCGKVFAGKSDLQRHLNAHTGEKPYQCTVCSKWFSLKCSLKTHMRIHDKEQNVCSTPATPAS